MLQRICLILLVCALALFLGGGLSQAGWSDLGLTNARDASSLIISVKKHKHHDDDEDNDNGLEQCTIQKPGSGMGCVSPLKLKCEKMKNGKKCCGCVGEKPGKAVTTPAPAQAPKQICCSATAIDRDNNNRTVQPGGCGATQEAAESQLKNASSINHWDIQGAISCAPQ
jgi:hypothetical protein